eukprot:gb/GFBE01054324.1/.p1 GENE.gb/GFBE01054324.1/~~gb/GFBE01054324.1/.p1  ORF type:complete len:216 (+),score=43.77 gb/GFBE01054324.1/:1-648(+)
MAAMRFRRNASRGLKGTILAAAGVTFLALASLEASGAGSCAVMLQDPESKKSGKAVLSKAVMQYLAQKAATGEFWYSNHYDTNAIGEGWRGASMRHWVDRAGADESAENLERELMATRIGRRSAHEGRRLAMAKKRQANQQLYEEQREAREQRRANKLLALSAWDPAALGERWRGSSAGAEEADLEQELQSITVAHVAGNEGRRLAMKTKRRTSA